MAGNLTLKRTSTCHDVRIGDIGQTLRDGWFEESVKRTRMQRLVGAKRRYVQRSPAKLWLPIERYASWFNLTRT
jgi:hypothetical protein